MKQPRSKNQQVRRDAQTPFGHGDGGCPILLDVGTKGERRGRRGEAYEGSEAAGN